MLPHELSRKKMELYMDILFFKQNPRNERVIGLKGDIPAKKYLTIKRPLLNFKFCHFI
jgi:hypothetical protein